MDLLLNNHLPFSGQVVLWLCLLIALGFEFVNGFHDTANAVATVIYTRTLKPQLAVLLSGIFNFIGVFLGGVGVAIGIVNLLPPELAQTTDAVVGLTMVLGMLCGAIVWNLGTWFVGIPASSSHTLIGAIIGVGLAHSLLPGQHFGDGVNWASLGSVLLSLIVSPFFGFLLSLLLMKAARRVIRSQKPFTAPNGEAPPPWPIRLLLIFTSMGVSTAHGSNDGQKGIGLILLILSITLPQQFANLVKPEDFAKARKAVSLVLRESCPPGTLRDPIGCLAYERFNVQLAQLETKLADFAAQESVSTFQRAELRSLLRDMDDTYLHVTAQNRDQNLRYAPWHQHARKAVVGLFYPIPFWTPVAVALALGFGTMVGWKRIVVTIGEKIGKDHLTYAQGAAAELVAASTIGVAAISGLPVSTTHVLSSGVAGAMIAEKSGVNAETVNRILLAWFLTLPATMLLSGGLYLLLHFLAASLW